MRLVAELRTLNADQRSAFLASFLGWTLDAFDYFVLVFVIKDVAAEFHVAKSAVTLALTLTLACRPIGAYLFGLAADRYGRRVPLMVNILCYSVINFLCGFSPSLIVLLGLRALFGVAMGGEWGLGAALAMESVPTRLRGLLSGVLQEGYVVGYLLAAVVYRVAFPVFGWRAMFWISALPALLTLFIRAKVKESPVWEEQRRQGLTADRSAPGIGAVIRQHGKLFAYLVVLMTAFNLMSHGTQDLYPTFLQVQRKLSPETVSNMAILYNLGALGGGIFFGSVSQRIGRRRAIIIAALLALPVVPLWVYAPSVVTLTLGAILMQFCVQGAWGVIPAHLAELAPNALRSTFTGFAYQVGNLIASVNAPLQTRLAERNGNDFALALSSVIVVVLLAVALVTALGREAPSVEFAAADREG
jgi:SHS family lactate transporter-like MFS transporter